MSRNSHNPCSSWTDYELNAAIEKSVDPRFVDDFRSVIDGIHAYSERWRREREAHNGAANGVTKLPLARYKARKTVDALVAEGPYRG